MPRFSPDGSSLYYFTHDPPSLRRVAASGGRAETVVDGWLWGEVLAWLDPSGRAVAYTQGMGPKRRARIRELATGQERALAAPIAVSSWSRAGDAVLGTTDEGEVTRCAADGGACKTLGRGHLPVPSADGSRIFFHRRGRALDDRTLQSVELWVMSASGGDERKVATLEPQSTLATRCDISPRDECVWVQFRRGKQELWLAQLRAGP
jgi:Tol biopolymer transport system component